MQVKMITAEKFALVALSLIKVSTCFTWNNPELLLENRTVPACVGMNLSLPWKYVMATDETLIQIKWSYQKNESFPEEVFAIGVNDKFYVIVASAPDMDYLPNAGITVNSVTTASNGYYRVQVAIEIDGDVMYHARTARVEVTDPIVQNNELIAAIEDARFMKSTQEHHLILSCGTVLPAWVYSIDINWTDPNNQTLPNTFVEENHFSLAVPNPIVSGFYSCHIAKSSIAWYCVKNVKTLMMGGQVDVDAITARVTILESETSILLARTETDKTDVTELTKRIQTRQACRDEINDIIEPLEHWTSGIRLYRGSNKTSGLVQIYFHGYWGTVCDNDWDDVDAKVVCRQLGYPYSNAKGLRSDEHGWEYVNGPVFREKVNCNGNEMRIQNCGGPSAGVTTCALSQVAGANCQSKSASRQEAAAERPEPYHDSV